MSVLCRKHQTIGPGCSQCREFEEMNRNAVYVIGALGNPEVIPFTIELEEQGFNPFSEWHTPGPEADTYLLKYAKARGWSYKRALESYAARHVFEFDKEHIDRCPIVVMLAPTGKSGHLELGYALGQGKRGYIYFPTEPERFDVMYQFATGIFFDKAELFDELRKQIGEKT